MPFSWVAFLTSHCPDDVGNREKGLMAVTKNADLRKRGHGWGSAT